MVAADMTALRRYGFRLPHCPICGIEVIPFRKDFWACASCGGVRFRAGNPDDLSPKDKAMLAAYLRERNASGATQTVILETVPSGFAEGEGVSLEDALESMRGVFSSPTKRLNRALLSIGHVASGLGQEVVVTHPAMVYAEDGEAQVFILDALKDAGYITWKSCAGERGGRVRLTLAGHERIAELQAKKPENEPAAPHTDETKPTLQPIEVFMLAEMEIIPKHGKVGMAKLKELLGGKCERTIYRVNKEAGGKWAGWQGPDKKGLYDLNMNFHITGFRERVCALVREKLLMHLQSERGQGATRESFVLSRLKRQGYTTGQISAAVSFCKTLPWRRKARVERHGAEHNAQADEEPAGDQ